MFKIVNRGSSSNLLNKYSGRLIAPEASKPRDNTYQTVQSWSSSDKNTNWFLQKVGTKRVKFIHKNGGRCLYCTGGNIQERKCQSTSYQYFDLLPGDKSHIFARAFKFVSKTVSRGI